MTSLEILLQQIITGLSNGMIIALVALGYTMVYGIVELINFAHGDLFMLGTFLSLTIVGIFGLDSLAASGAATAGTLALIMVIVPCFCASLNWTVDRVAYRPLRKAPKLAPLVSAIGVSFIFMNLGQFWGGLPMDVFSGGRSAAAPKSFPPLVPNTDLLALLGLDTAVQFTWRDLMVFGVTIPLLAGFTLFVKRATLGKAMRATAQNPTAAELMGIDVNRVIGVTFAMGGALAGFAAVIYPLFNPTIYFQLGFRTGMDAFTAAVLGGIGNLPGAMLGGILIGLVRAMSDQYVEARWTNSIVFAVLVLILIFRPSGILGARTREKV
jgi:branched-chain amino acid transport system permease protein